MTVLSPRPLGKLSASGWISLLFRVASLSAREGADSASAGLGGFVRFPGGPTCYFQHQFSRAELAALVDWFSPLLSSSGSLLVGSSWLRSHSFGLHILCSRRTNLPVHVPVVRRRCCQICLLEGPVHGQGLMPPLALLLSLSRGLSGVCPY